MWVWRRYARRERIKQQYSSIAADKLYSDVADEDYAPKAAAAAGVSMSYVQPGRSPLRRPPAHVWQLPLPQPRDDVTAGGCATSSAYGVGSIDSRYYVLDHNLGSSSVIPTNDDIQFAQWPTPRAVVSTAIPTIRGTESPIAAFISGIFREGKFPQKRIFPLEDWGCKIVFYYRENACPISQKSAEIMMSGIPHAWWNGASKGFIDISQTAVARVLFRQPQRKLGS